MPGIIVVTHNGELPRNGGRRIGYMVDNKVVFTMPGCSITVVHPPEPPPPEAPARDVMSLLQVLKLPRARTHWDNCFHCGSTRTQMAIEPIQGGGAKALLKCAACGKLTRPFYD